jgi:hypothetical protein
MDLSRDRLILELEPNVTRVVKRGGIRCVGHVDGLKS